MRVKSTHTPTPCTSFTLSAVCPVVGVLVVRGVCGVCGARDVCCVVGGEVVALKTPMMEHRFAEKYFVSARDAA